MRKLCRLIAALALLLIVTGFNCSGGGGEGAISGPLSQKPQIVSDGNGNFMAMWQAGISIWSRYYPGGSGEQDFRLGNGASSEEDNAPHLAMSANGNAFVVWRSDTEGQAATRRYVASQGDWEDTKTIPPTLPLGAAPVIMAPNIAADSLGNHFAAFLGGSGLSGGNPSVYVSRHNDTDTNWFGACNLDQSDVALGAMSDFPIAPQVVLDRHQSSESDRRALIVWGSADPNEPGIKAARVSQETFGIGGVLGSGCFRNLVPVEVFRGQVNSEGPQVATNNNGTVIAVWVETGQLSVARYDFAPDSWSDVQSLESFSTILALTILVNPQIAMNASSNAFVVWVDQRSNVNRIRVRRHLGGVDWAVAWEAAVSINDANAQSVSNPHVAIDSNGNAIVVWEQDGEIHANRYNVTTNAWLGPQTIGTGQNPKVAMDSGGIAIAVWERDGFIFDFIWGPPTASFDFSPTNPAPGDQVGFDAGASRDDDGQIVQYEWDFEDDGTFDASGVTATTTYPTAGIFTARLRVTDNDGLINEITVAIDVGAFTLTVIKAGNGTGTVTSSDGGIDCGPDCSETYRDGDSVTLSAVPDSGFEFTGWDCGGTLVSSATLPLTMISSITCTATFGAPADSFTLTVTILGGPDAGEVFGDGGFMCINQNESSTTCAPQIYPAGTEVFLRPVAFGSNTGVSWGGCDTDVGIEGCSVMMNSDRLVTVLFQ